MLSGAGVRSRMYALNEATSLRVTRPAKLSTSTPPVAAAGFPLSMGPHAGLGPVPKSAPTAAASVASGAASFGGDGGHAAAAQGLEALSEHDDAARRPTSATERLRGPVANR